MFPQNKWASVNNRRGVHPPYAYEAFPSCHQIPSPTTTTMAQEIFRMSTKLNEENNNFIVEFLSSESTLGYAKYKICEDMYT